MRPSQPSLQDQIRRFEREHTRRPEGLVFARLGEAYRRSGERQLALAVLDRGLRRHPDYAAAHLVRARTLLDLEQDEDARASFRRVLELDPGNLVALRGAASLARRAGDREEERRWATRIREARASRGAPASHDGAPAGAGGGSGSSGGRATHSPEEAHRLREELAELRVGLAGTEGDEGAGNEGVGIEGAGEVGARQADAGEADARGGDDGSTAEDVCTETMARLYAAQGRPREAERIYEALLRRRPDDAELRRRLAALRGEADPPAAEEAAPAAAGRTAAGRDEEAAVTAREHFRALLRGEAGASRRAPEEAGESEALQRLFRRWQRFAGRADASP